MFLGDMFSHMTRRVEHLVKRATQAWLAGMGLYVHKNHRGIWRFSKIGVAMGSPKSSGLMGLSLLNHPIWGTPIYRNPHTLSIKDAPN